MKPTLTLLTALVLAPLATHAQQTTTPPTPRIVGDGTHDDTAAIQALLDTRRTLVHLPSPPKHYRISKTLCIHSNQTLQLDRFTVIRLKDGSDCLMITNDEHDGGNENIALVGGVWDMNNEGQSLAEYQKTRIWKGDYDPSLSLIWIDAPAVVSGLTMSDLRRTETVWPLATLVVEPGATIQSLQLTQATIFNRTPGPLDLLVNRGTIERLSLSQVHLEASKGPERGTVIRNDGKIRSKDIRQVSVVNAATEAIEEAVK